MTTYQLARIGVTVAGSHPMRQLVEREFASLPRLSQSKDTLHLEFGDGLQVMDSFVSLKPLQVSRDSFHVNRGRLQYSVTREGECLRVAVMPRRESIPRRLVPRWVRRTANLNYLFPSEVAAKDFMYDVFDYLSQIELLAAGCSYVHASSISKDGEAVALLAWGGVGKTSSMLKLITEHGWRYLSDDLGLIDDEAEVWRTPKRIQIYAYNVENQPGLTSALMDGRSPADRMAWKIRLALLGPERVRRRVSPEDFFGAESTDLHCPLGRAVFLQRGTVSTFRVSRMSRAELVRRAVSTLLRELQPYVEISAAMYSGPLHPIVPDIGAFSRQCTAVLDRAFEKADPILLEIPLAAEPDALAETLIAALH